MVYNDLLSHLIDLHTDELCQCPIDLHLCKIFTLYFINPGDFEISSGGYILVKKALDAEVKPLYNLTIEATDLGQPRRSNTVSNY